MANYVKGNVQFTPVVEQINRKWAPKKKTCSATKKVGPVTTESHSWMGSATRTVGRAGLGPVSKNYFVFRENARVSAVLSDELRQRSAFIHGNEWANVAAKDLMAINHNHQVFIELKDNPSGYIAFSGGDRLYAAGYSFMGFLRAYAIKQAKIATADLPVDHKLPTPTIPS